MKSVGEIMALGRNFEEVMQKGLRMLQIGMKGFSGNKSLYLTEEKIEDGLVNATPRRVLAIYEALNKGWSTKKISDLTGIDEWFLGKLENIVKHEKTLKKADTLDKENLLTAKKLGFSDAQVGDIFNLEEADVRTKRKKMGIIPVTKQIDTLAAEYPSETNYLYMTYHGTEDDVDYSKVKTNKIITLGSGAYCIGSSVEFDWCCVNAVTTAAANGMKL
jgi:carbamoyl-phosphate synthase large subunit